MNKKQKRTLIAVIALVVSLGVILLLGITTAPKNSDNTKETTSQTLTDEQKQNLATNNAEQAFNLVMEDVTAQLGEDLAGKTQINSQTFGEDAEGKPAMVAFLAISNIDPSFNYEQNADNVIKIITEKTSDNPEWKYELVTSENLEEGSTILKAIKTWEDSDEPLNPAILDFVYSTYDEEGVTKYAIYVSATVY